MKKLVSIFAVVLAFTMMSVTSFAAASFEIKENAPTYEGTTVTPAADSIEVTTATTAGNYYGVLLVEGNTLPTVDTDILYINQVTADAETETFNVLPIIPAANTDVTLYVSSNVSGAELITVPMTYAEEVVAPTNDYITTADTAKGTIAVNVASVTDTSMGAAVGNSISSLDLNDEVYTSTGYIIKAVAADGSDVEGAAVYYSKERGKYVAVIPTTVSDYKFEVIAAGTEGVAANEEIVMYGNMNEDANGYINASDLLTFRKYVKKASAPTVKQALLADVSGDGKINATDLLQFRKAVKKQDYNFAVTSK